MNRILFVQNGDFREAYQRFAVGGEETYRDQKASVSFVSSLAPEAHVTTLAFTRDAYDEELAPNLGAMGRRRRSLDHREIGAIFDSTRPNHVVLRTPHLGVLHEARRRGVWLLPVFADLFARDGLRQAWRNARLARALLQAKAPCISNHSLNASLSMVDVLGIPEDRIVPWDWKPVPLSGTPKTGVRDRSRPTLFFAGAMTSDKGVGDCLAALSRMKVQGLRAKMRFAGSGDLTPWTARAAELGVSDEVTFLGRIPNTRVRQEMRNSDFVVVPSRHSYPEGLPNTIYEALASRSVLLLSDHPAFAGRLRAEEECLVFPAADPDALADCVRRGTQNNGLYGKISRNSARAHESLYVGMDWFTLVNAFLDDPGNSTGWVGPMTLAARPTGVPA